MIKFIFVLFLIFISCTTPLDSPYEEGFLGITETDSDGNLIGGIDQDDWCEFEFNMSSLEDIYGLNPIYPNPVILEDWGVFENSYQICYQYSTPYDSTWSHFNEINIDIISTSSDTIYTYNDEYVNGQGAMCAYISDSLVVDSIYRMFMKSESFECYGDIQFIQ